MTVEIDSSCLTFVRPARAVGAVDSKRNANLDSMRATFFFRHAPFSGAELLPNVTYVYTPTRPDVNSFLLTFPLRSAASKAALPLGCAPRPTGSWEKGAAYLGAGEENLLTIRVWGRRDHPAASDLFGVSSSPGTKFLEYARMTLGVTEP